MGEEEVIQEVATSPTPNGSSTGAPSPAFSQSQAGYTSSRDRCGGCSHFQQPSACEYVQGVIEPEGSCPLHSNLAGVGGGVGMPPTPEVGVEIEVEPLGEEEEV